MRPSRGYVLGSLQLVDGIPGQHLELQRQWRSTHFDAGTQIGRERHELRLHLTIMQKAYASVAAEDDGSDLATLSSTLAPMFRGKFCNLLLPGRSTTIFEADEVLYEKGDGERRFYFVQSGVVKTGTIAADGREIVYDLRKERDVIGELCALYTVRRDRAVALARTVTVAVPFDQVLEVLTRHAPLVRDFVELFCGALADAYENIDSLAFDSVLLRTAHVLDSLAKKFGRRVGDSVELPVYLTQQELAQMVVARRERVSTALNGLRRKGIVHYSTRGHLRLDIRKLSQYRLSDAATTSP